MDREIQASGDVNVSTQADAAIDYAATVDRVYTHIDGVEARVRQSLQAVERLDLIPHFVRFIGPRMLAYNGTVVTADRVVINTGAQPSIPNIPGLADTPYMTSTDILRRRDRCDHLLVLGGGYIGCELSHWQSAAGAKVTQLVRSTTLKHTDEEVREEFMRVYTSHVTVREHTTPTSVAYDEHSGLFSLSLPDGEVLTGDGLLVATGVTPATKGLGVEEAGLALTDRGFIQTDKYF
ncbi:hypothetical protein KIPB_011480, partial [Kipferlia bialata]|eukprot:g11480.t1